MVVQEKELGLVDLENFLKQTFPEDKNKVNILLEQIAKSRAELEKETGEANPFFYGAVSKYMRATASKGIDSWVDSKGNVNIAQINAVVKIAKKRFELAKKDAENKENEVQKRASINEESQQPIPEELKQEFEKIDFDNLTLDNMLTLSSNWEYAIYNIDTEKLDKYIEVVADEFEIEKDVSNLMKQDVRKRRGELTKEEQEEFEQGLKKVNMTEKEIHNFNGAIQTIKERCLNNFKENGDILLEDIDAFIRKLEPEVQALFNREPALIDKEAFIESIKNKAKEEQKAKEEEEKKKAETARDENTVDTEKTPEELGTENDAMMAEMMDMQLDFSFMGEDFVFEKNGEQQSSEVAIEEGQFAQEVNQEYDKAQVEQSSGETEVSKEPEESVAVAEEQEQPQPSAPEEIDAEDKEAESYREETTFKDNGPGGILGFLSAMASKIIPKRWQERFMPKDKQEQLPAGKVEVTKENGIKQTSYFENGSLESWTIQARNVAIGIGKNVMNAISKMVGASDRSEENAVKNRPIVIKSEEQKEQDEQQKAQELNEQQNVNVFDRQEGEKRDDNPWAVKVKNDMEEVAIAELNETHDKAVATKDSKPVVEQEGQEK